MRSVADPESLRELVERCNSGSSIPPVAAADVKACWEFWQRQEEADRQFSGKIPVKAVGVDLIAPYLSPGADVCAVGLRYGFLEIMAKFGVLEPWLREGTLDDAVYRAAAEHPFKSGDFDPASFVARIRTQTDNSISQ